MDARDAPSHLRRFGRDQCFRQARTRWSHNAIAHKASQSAVIVGTKAVHGFESRHRTSAVDDQHGRAALHTVNQRAEIVLGFGDTGLFHNSQNSLIGMTLQAGRRSHEAGTNWMLCLTGVSGIGSVPSLDPPY